MKYILGFLIMFSFSLALGASGKAKKESQSASSETKQTLKAFESGKPENSKPACTIDESYDSIYNELLLSKEYNGYKKHCAKISPVKKKKLKATKEEIAEIEQDRKLCLEATFSLAARAVDVDSDLMTCMISQEAGKEKPLENKEQNAKVSKQKPPSKTTKKIVEAPNTEIIGYHEDNLSQLGPDAIVTLKELLLSPKDSKFDCDLYKRILAYFSLLNVSLPRDFLANPKTIPKEGRVRNAIASNSTFWKKNDYIHNIIAGASYLRYSRDHRDPTPRAKDPHIKKMKGESEADYQTRLVRYTTAMRYNGNNKINKNGKIFKEAYGHEVVSCIAGIPLRNNGGNNLDSDSPEIARQSIAPLAFREPDPLLPPPPSNEENTSPLPQ